MVLIIIVHDQIEKASAKVLDNGMFFFYCLCNCRKRGHALFLVPANIYFTQHRFQHR